VSLWDFCDRHYLVAGMVGVFALCVLGWCVTLAVIAWEGVRHAALKKEKP
jgi:hypothetical protein